MTGALIPRGFDTIIPIEKIIFNHNDLDDLEQKLKKVKSNKPKMIAFESVYSMDGDIAPIKEICDLAKKYKPQIKN